ncbi:hypothetical protein [Paenirhodobacter populi]|uniref:Uncharacterized protein n=1 Tax=Paenirhodobacter populi TaxID=2306993 RepID=A0A443JIS0_9RHOB|nr:hypothetical protein [Sinirhodobacter populi]RWR20499.1 hypothetical protein D2T30_11520 [Sinirhodobacter populi]
MLADAEFAGIRIDRDLRVIRIAQAREMGFPTGDGSSARSRRKIRIETTPRKYAQQSRQA